MSHDVPTYTEVLPDLADHPLFAGKPMGMMSAENPVTHATLPGGRDTLRKLLQDQGLKWEETTGQYGGTPEHTFLIHGPTREHMFHLGRALGQESVVYANGGHRNAELLYTNGPKAGGFHPAHPEYSFHPTEPFADDYTTLPGKGHVRLYFNFDRLHPAPIRSSAQMMPQPAPAPEAPATKTDIAKALLEHLVLLAKSQQPSGWAGSYPWHEGHHAHNHKRCCMGIVVPEHYFTGLRKDVAPMGHPHTAAHGLPPAPKPDFSGGQALKTNDQAGVAGTSKAYGRFAAPYGTVDRSSPSNLKFYPLEGKHDAATAQVAHHGYQHYYAGGKHGKPDLANRNYTTKHLMVYDPEAGSGGDFGETTYTDAWRKTHELAHALTLDTLNQKYGEGRRMGALGKHRTMREAQRAVEWEWHAAHKQRELAADLGVHISDDDFHRELNTVMHDAVHRAITGKFSDPAHEGFRPHAHKVPLETALGMVRDAGREMGLKGEHDLLQKSASFDTSCRAGTNPNLTDTTESNSTMADTVTKKEIAGALAGALSKAVAMAKAEDDLRKSRAAEAKGANRLAKNTGVLPEPAGQTLEMNAMEGYGPQSDGGVPGLNKDEVANTYPAGIDCPTCGSGDRTEHLGDLGGRSHFICHGCGQTMSHAAGGHDVAPVSPVAKEEKSPSKKIDQVETAEERKKDGTVLPGDKEIAEVEAEGSGGDVKKGKLGKDEMRPNARDAIGAIQAQKPSSSAAVASRLKASPVKAAAPKPFKKAIPGASHAMRAAGIPSQRPAAAPAPAAKDPALAATVQAPARGPKAIAARAAARSMAPGMTPALPAGLKPGNHHPDVLSAVSELNNLRGAGPGVATAKPAPVASDDLGALAAAHAPGTQKVVTSGGRPAPFVKKPAADDKSVAMPEGPGQVGAGATSDATLAADKKAAGVGFLSNLISKFRGAGKATWDAASGAGPASTARATRTMGRRMALSEKTLEKGKSPAGVRGTPAAAIKKPAPMTKAAGTGVPAAPKAPAAPAAAGTKAPGAPATAAKPAKPKSPTMAMKAEKKPGSKTVLGAGMSPEALAADTDQSDREYIAQKKAKKATTKKALATANHNRALIGKR